MNLYGYTLDEIYRSLPWHFRLMMILGIAFLIFISYYFVNLATADDYRTRPGPIEFTNTSYKYSGYDPALASDGETTLLAFTNGFHRAAQNAGGEGAGIEIAVAKSNCEKWQLLTKETSGLSPYDDIIVAPDQKTSIAAGRWYYETPGLVYDAGDTGHEWKLFAYKYLWPKDQNFATVRRYSMIVMRTASDPQGEWSIETPVFGAATDYPPAPYDTGITQRLNMLDASLQNIALYARPSVINLDGTLVMSLSAFKEGEMQPDRTIMIASEDHGRNWRYLGTPIGRADAKSLSAANPEEGDIYNKYSGASLIKKNGVALLAAVFGNNESISSGTLVFSFADINKAKLRRDEDTDAPVKLNTLPRLSGIPTQIGGGFAAFNDACASSGMLTGEHSGILQRFQIFQSRQQPYPAD